MKTLTVRLPEALAAQIEAESRERRLSKSDIVRERLTRTEPSDQKRPAGYELIADLIGSIDDPRLPTDLSARKKHYLKAAIMAANVVVDAGFLAALFIVRDFQSSLGGSTGTSLSATLENVRGCDYRDFLYAGAPK